jgi:hypothetical protein
MLKRLSLILLFLLLAAPALAAAPISAKTPANCESATRIPKTPIDDTTRNYVIVCNLKATLQSGDTLVWDAQVGATFDMSESLGGSLFACDMMLATSATSAPAEGFRLNENAGLNIDRKRHHDVHNFGGSMIVPSSQVGDRWLRIRCWSGKDGLALDKGKAQITFTIFRGL